MAQHSLGQAWASLPVFGGEGAARARWQPVGHGVQSLCIGAPSPEALLQHGHSCCAGQHGPLQACMDVTKPAITLQGLRLEAHLPLAVAWLGARCPERSQQASCPMCQKHNGRGVFPWHLACEMPQALKLELHQLQHKATDQVLGLGLQTKFLAWGSSTATSCPMPWQRSCKLCMPGDMPCLDCHSCSSRGS